jgi:hypothetical protein
MEILLLIIIGIPALSLIGAMLVSRMVYNKLLKAGNKHPKLIRAIVFVGSFAVIFVAIYFLVNQNVRFER